MSAATKLLGVLCICMVFWTLGETATESVSDVATTVMQSGPTTRGVGSTPSELTTGKGVSTRSVSTPPGLTTGRDVSTRSVSTPPGLTTGKDVSTRSVSTPSGLTTVKGVSTRSVSTPPELTTGRDVSTKDVTTLPELTTSPDLSTDVDMTTLSNMSLVITEPEPTTTYLKSTAMDVNGDYMLYWKFTEETIQFEVHVRTLGYVGLGFTPTGGMTNADIVIGWVKDGKAFLTDRFASRRGEPTIDESQDYRLIEGFETSTYTVLVFERDLITCDEKDRVINDGTTTVIWSYSDIDPEDEVGLPYHGAINRGAKSFFLLERSGFVDLTGVPLQTHTFQNPNITVSDVEEKTYWCQVFKMPDYGTKHHLVKYWPYITPGNEGVVSEMYLRSCSEPIDETLIGVGYDCYGRGKPANVSSCTNTFMSWTVGSPGFYYPVEAGLSLFDYANGDAQYVVLQTTLDHGLNSSVVDSSGLEISFTAQLRQYDAGFLTLGSQRDETFIIPPGRKKFTTQSHCSISCTDEAYFNTTGITVFASVVSAGRYAKSVATRRDRNGKEGVTLAENKNFDYKTKNIRLSNKAYLIRPGDNFITSCVYDTSQLTRVVYGGHTSNTEHCMSRLVYYPRRPFVRCTSQLDLDYALYRLAGITELSHDTFPPTVVLPKYHTGKSATRIFEDLEWTKDQAKILEAAYGTAFNAFCRNNDGSFLQSSGKFNYVPVLTRYKTDEDVCGSATQNSPYRMLTFIPAVCSAFIYSTYLSTIFMP